MKPDRPVRSSSIVVKMRFTFAGQVTEEELRQALIRCFRTKQFRLVGRYEMIETYEEVGLEPAEPVTTPASPGAHVGEFVDVDKAYKR